MSCKKTFQGEFVMSDKYCGGNEIAIFVVANGRHQNIERQRFATPKFVKYCKNSKCKNLFTF